jgi:sugar lactone lactonase YvrE
MTTATHICPRRVESPMTARLFPGGDTYDRADGTCSYCGSLNPDVLMARLEAGDVRITPTDKNYKVYVVNEGGEQFMQCYRETAGGPMLTREVEQTKFYFQHFSDEQKQRFVELVNEGRVKFSYPGHFYVLPFFVRREPEAT